MNVFSWNSIIGKTRVGGFVNAQTYKKINNLQITYQVQKKDLVGANVDDSSGNSLLVHHG